MDDLFKRLNINKDNGLFLLTDKNWQFECNFSSRVKKIIKEKLKPDAFFVFDNKPLILFYDSPENIENIHKALWNFNESPIIMIVDNRNVNIYNGFNYLRDNNTLEWIGDRSYLNDFKYFELVTGKTWEKYESELKYENRVDYHLLENIKAARKFLIDDLNFKKEIANALIGKSIFVRYLIDRKVKIGFKGEEKYWSNDDFCSLLENLENSIKFFKYLDGKFNGDMFILEDYEYLEINQEALNEIIKLINSEDLSNGQPSLFNLYDFSIIPIEFISNVYESFIGEKNQEMEGAYYTPLFLVDYIINETVEKFQNENPLEYHCRVLDPACGSGIFLVEALRKIIEKYIHLNPDIDLSSDEFKEALRNIAKNNIFGIDKNLSAIQVAIFSIQLTLLDYQESSDIEKFKFPPLLNTNFFEADFFNTDHEFNNILKEKDIDFIIGNPPWKINGMDSIGKKYLKERKKEEKKKKYSISVNRGEIAEGFVLRVSDFTTIETEISLIVRSSILYNLGYKKNRSHFRDYWTEEYHLKKIFELAPVRKEVFDKSNDPSIAPAAILFYKYANGEKTDDNIIEHLTLKPSRFFSLFKLLIVNKNDIKKIKQKRLKEYDWLWKVLVYGSYFDFNFIKEFNSRFLTIGDIINNKDKYEYGKGIDDSGNRYSAKHLNKYKFIPTKCIQSFYIIQNNLKNFQKNNINRPRNENLFKAPMLLIRNGLNTQTLKARAAISLKDFVFKKAVTSIKALDKKNILELQNINAILSSNIFIYLAINTFSDIGIEREQTKQANLFSIPFIEVPLSDYVTEIEQLNIKIQEEKKRFPVDESIINSLSLRIDEILQKIDLAIFDKLQLTDTEKAIISYSLEVNRAIITRKQGELPDIFDSIDNNDPFLENYAQLFVNRFSKSLDSETRKFIVEIWYSKQIIGMFFKDVPRSDNLKNIVWKDKSKDDLLKIAIELSSQKITDKLFVQKDLRGFEKDYFYVFKPNEKRLWHKAIGYQDVEEFMDAILRSGRRGNVGT